ncbi:MAG: hypothetical protein LBD08_04435 [Treponema sp.]|jgi:hypothetical protein|nr:hypothetical protein [Treponema sp.]
MKLNKVKLPRQPGLPWLPRLPKLPWLLCCLGVLAFLAIRVAGEGLRLHAAGKAAASLEKSLANMAPLDLASLEELRVQAADARASVQPPSLTADLGAEIRSLLSGAGIRPGRFRAANQGAGGKAGIECTFRCDPPQFLDFLSRWPERAAFSLSSLSVKVRDESRRGEARQDFAPLDVTLRVSEEPGLTRYAAGTAACDPQSLAGLFSCTQAGPYIPDEAAFPPGPGLGSAAVLDGAAAAAAAAARSTVPVPSIEAQFILIGSVKSAQDGERLYLKEQETGRLISVAGEAVVESAAETCLIRIEDQLFTVRRN